MKLIKTASSKCRYCDGEIISRCRCSRPHTIEHIKKGHGVLCENGHRFSGDIMIEDKEAVETHKKYDKQF